MKHVIECIHKCTRTCWDRPQLILVYFVKLHCITRNAFSLQGSSAFVYGWVAFADRLSNGIAVKIVQQFLPLQQSRYCISLNYDHEHHKRYVYRLQEYYRYVLIGLPFVGSALGLFTISSMLFVESLQRWKEKKKVMFINFVLCTCIILTANTQNTNIQ